MNQHLTLTQLLFNKIFLYFLAFFILIIGIVKIFVDIPLIKESSKFYKKSHIEHYIDRTFTKGRLHYAQKFTGKELFSRYPETDIKNIKVKAIYKKVYDGFALLEIDGKSIFLKVNQSVKGYTLVEIEKNYIILKKKTHKYKFILSGFQTKGKSKS